MATASSSKTAIGGAAAPSPTLYVKNIEGKVKKPELRRQLHSLFSTYGRILDVIATRAPSMRGQAFVVFDSLSTSSAAKRGLSGFSFYGKPLVIEYSTGEKSRALLKREIGDEAVMEMDLEKSQTAVSRRGEKRVFLGGDNDDEDADHADDVDGDDGAEARAKRIKTETTTTSAAAAEEFDETTVEALDLPASIDDQVLHALFSRQAGFTGVTRSAKSEEAPGDVETWSAKLRFDTQHNANAAKAKLQGVQIDPLYSLRLV